MNSTLYRPFSLATGYGTATVAVRLCVCGWNDTRQGYTKPEGE